MGFPALTFLTTFAVSVLLTAVVRVLAWRWGIVDQPDGNRKLHPRPVPLWGGVAVYLAIVAGLGVARHGAWGATQAYAELAATVIGAAGLVCFVGCVDDAFRLLPRTKLLMQVAAVVPVVTAGCCVHRLTLFGMELQLGALSGPLTVLWLVGCINAVNLLDGMDGLASMVGFSTAVTMGCLGAYLGNDYVAAVAAVLAGSLAGFFVHNRPPASIFLGDSGSMVIGLVVGILGIQSTLKTPATLSITAPLVVMTFPMFDTFLAVVRRKLTGRRFDAADRQHIHHRLLDRGMGPWRVLGIIAALCLATGAAAVAATILCIDALAWATAGMLIVLVIRLRWFGHHELALIAQAVGRWAGGLLPPAAPVLAAEPPARFPLPNPQAARVATDRHGPPVRYDVDLGVTCTSVEECAEYLPRLLATLRDSCDGLRVRLILVDNQSRDGLGAWSTAFPHTLVLRNEQRLSYAANLNRILEVSAARYVLLLNPDMHFDPQEQCISRMARFMDSRPHCGIAGCRIYRADGQYAHPARRFQTVPVILARRLNLGSLARRTLDYYLYGERRIGETWSCDWLSGCFLMIRREAFEDVGFFDEGFVKYFEDVEMCLRMALAGWEVMHYGGTYCYHLEQRASRKLLSCDAWRHLCSYLRWQWKWGAASRRVECTPARRRQAA